MPFYAVAVGKIPGVYKTWEECQNQTKGYPKTKFKKFDTEREANEFVRSVGSDRVGSFSGASSSISTSIENLRPPELRAPSKYSLPAFLKQDKLSLIADKLDQFMEQTNKTLNELSKRLDFIETHQSGSSAEGKRKSNPPDEEDNIHSKKKKTAVTVEILDEVASTKTTRSKTKPVNNGVEEVDYPWGTNNSQSPDGFVIGPDGFTIVYTDGACSNNGKVGAKAGIGVWFNHNHPFNVAAPVKGNATNNNAEIQAATRAIEQAALAGISKLNIHTDSQFMINCMTDWIKKWKKKDWKTSTGGPVKNKEQLVLLDKAIQKMDAVKWTHIRGHMGYEGNECADALARSGATMYQVI